jgi:putative protein-disulfide isomerase
VNKEVNKTIPEHDRISITYYTDPLCCWSHAMQPAMNKLKEEYDTASWRYVMGGLIPDWQSFSDPVNSVTRPLQMGPVWMHASRVSNVFIDHNLWFRDPPVSSYPACIAFKSVQLQSNDYAVEYLNLLWEYCMVQGINTSKQEELIKIAAELNDVHADFDIKTFQADLTNGNGLAAFKNDIREVKMNNINRFPTLIFRLGRRSLLVTGYRPYESLEKVMEQLFAGSLQ